MLDIILNVYFWRQRLVNISSIKGNTKISFGVTSKKQN